jgi:hypothetical protein
MPEENEATISLQLLATAAEAGEDFVAPHVPAITAAVQGEISKHIPPHPEPWPQVRSKGSRCSFLSIDISTTSHCTPVSSVRAALYLVVLEAIKIL